METTPTVNQQISRLAGAPPPINAVFPTAMPLTGFLRLSQIIGDSKKGIPALIPLSKSTWWARVKDDPTWPQPHKLSSRCTAWLANDIQALIYRLAGNEVSA